MSSPALPSLLTKPYGYAFPRPRSYGKCGDFIQQHRKGMIELAPGCDADQSLEAAVTGVLNNIREQAAKVGRRGTRRLGLGGAGWAGGVSCRTGGGQLPCGAA